ncbi:MAG: GTPase ObgE [Spirochaetota bacterium]
MSRFVDEAEAVVKSGKGGQGAVSFRREKYVQRGGPDGGGGGDGGDVIVRVNRDKKTLYDVKLKGVFKAGGGHPGMGKNKTGKKGTDCIIEVPPGTEIWEKETSRLIADLHRESDEVVVLKGGKGGKGNAHFVSAVNRSPRIAQKGRPGGSMKLLLKMKMIADVGLVGLPNSGKSTLLSVLTSARPKIAGYPFTTLYPNLGVLIYKGTSQFIIADLPGITEGASQGHGLGIRFLKHIERTGMLVVLIDLLGDDYADQYRSLIYEMYRYSEGLPRKPKLIAGSKLDAAVSEQILRFQQWNIDENKVCISSFTGEGIEELKSAIAATKKSSRGFSSKKV